MMIKKVLSDASELDVAKYPSDKPDMQCGDDILGRFILDSQRPLSGGDALLLVGENLFQSLEHSEITNLLLNKDVSITIASFNQDERLSSSSMKVGVGMNSNMVEFERLCIPFRDFSSASASESSVDFDSFIFQPKFNQIWCNPDPTQCFFFVSVLSLYLKLGGVLKTVFPDGDHLRLNSFITKQQHLSVVQRFLPFLYQYRPLQEFGRGFLEILVVFERIENESESRTQVGQISNSLILSKESKYGGDFATRLSFEKGFINTAVEAFVSAQTLARKVQQTVWLRGCYVAALFIMEASSQSNSKSDVAAFRHYTTLSIMQSFFSGYAFVETEEESLFYEALKTRLGLEELQSNRRRVTATIRKYYDVVEDCIETWILLLSCPLTTFSKHNNLPPSFGLSGRLSGSDPVGNFILAKLVDARNMENSYTRFIKWLHAFVPRSIRTKAMINEEIESTLLLGSAETHLKELKVSIGITVDDPEESDDQKKTKKKTPRSNKRVIRRHESQSKVKVSEPGRDVASKRRKTRSTRRSVGKESVDDVVDDVSLSGANKAAEQLVQMRLQSDARTALVLPAPKETEAVTTDFLESKDSVSTTEIEEAVSSSDSTETEAPIDAAAQNDIAEEPTDLREFIVSQLDSASSDLLSKIVAVIRSHRSEHHLP